MFKETKAFSGFAVRDLEAAEKFYGGTLGIETSEEYGVLVLHFPESTNIFVYPKEDHEPANYTILNFPVDDINSAVAELMALGIKFERYEGFNQDEVGISREMGPPIAWFTDPSGNILSVIQGRPLVGPI